MGDYVRRIHESRKCVICSGEFQPKRSDTVTCSKKCQTVRKDRLHKIAREKRLIVTTVKFCKICQNPFFPLRINRRSYCSDLCKKAGRIQNVRRYKERKASASGGGFSNGG